MEQLQPMGDLLKNRLPPRFPGSGNALSNNPFPLLIPCHRIVRSDEKLVGFPQVEVKN